MRTPRFALELTLCMLLAQACAPRPRTPSPPIPARSGDDFIELAARADETWAAGEPSFAAAERHALELAQLARAASAAPDGTRYPTGAARLALAADAARDELLACQRPRWQLRFPWDDTSIGVATWLHVHERELRRGARDGWVATRRDVDSLIAGIDELSTTRRSDDARYSGPPVREFRAFLHDELRPVAREAPGLVHLPTGAACFEATGRSLAGDRWDSELVLHRAADLLREPHVTDGFDLRRHPAFDSPDHPATIWHPNAAIARGWQLYRATEDDRRGAAVVQLFAVGALVDVAIHRDGRGRDGAEALAADYPWITAEARRFAIERALDQPLWFSSAVIGFTTIVDLRDAARSQTDDFDAAAFDAAAFDVGPLPPELFESAMRSRLGLPRR